MHEIEGQIFILHRSRVNLFDAILIAVEYASDLLFAIGVRSHAPEMRVIFECI